MYLPNMLRPQTNKNPLSRKSTLCNPSWKTNEKLFTNVYKDWFTSTITTRRRLQQYLLMGSEMLREMASWTEFFATLRKTWGCPTVFLSFSLFHLCAPHPLSFFCRKSDFLLWKRIHEWYAILYVRLVCCPQVLLRFPITSLVLALD